MPGSSTVNMQARVLYLTMNPNLAFTTIPTIGWLSNLVPRGMKPILATSTHGEFLKWVEGQGHTCYTLSLTAPAWNGWLWMKTKRVDVYISSNQASMVSKEINRTFARGQFQAKNHREMK
jgi:hypothetical protein